MAVHITKLNGYVIPALMNPSQMPLYIKQQMPSLPSIKHETSFKIKTKIIIVRIVREQEKEGERENMFI